MSRRDDLRHAMAEALSGSGADVPCFGPGMVPSGGSMELHRAGGHYITLAGSSKLFHLPEAAARGGYGGG
jgi:hypothetical protein